MSHGTFEIAILPNLNDLQAKGGVERRLQPNEVWPITVEYRPSLSLSMSVQRTDGTFAYDPDALMAADSVWSRDYGTILGKALFRENIKDLFARARAETPDGQSLHVLLSLEAASLRTLNWHFLCSPVGTSGEWDYLGLLPRTPFSLYQAGATDGRFPPVGFSSFRVLLVLASPEGAEEAPRFNIDGMHKAVRAGLDAARVPCDVLIRAPGSKGLPTLQNVVDHLSRGNYTALHLVCHGRYMKEAADFSLYLEKDDGTADRVRCRTGSEWSHPTS